MIKIILYIWQLPQNLLGLLLVKLLKAEKHLYWIDKPCIVYHQTLFRKGVSLGDYIILNMEVHTLTTIKHEYGHREQSVRLGWLYLPVVGLPSLIRNRIHALYLVRKIGYTAATKWYYEGYPEKWADRLGKVKRYK